MKTLKTLLVFLAVALILPSCEDDNQKAILKTTVASNTLQPPSTDSYVLTVNNKENILDTFAWTAPDFGFPASVSYKLQIDKASNNFADAVEVVSTNSLEAPVNVGAFNDLLLGLGLSPEEAADVDVRTVSTISDKVPPVYSNTQTITVTPYATSFPSIYGMGEALNGWGPWPDKAVEWPSSEYKKYETMALFTNGKAFRFFSQLDWGPTSYNYPFFTTVDPLFENANDGDLNLKFIGTTGWYKVNVDLVAKIVTAVAVEEPLLYMVGAAVGGWDQAKAVKMAFVKPGVFEGTANFTVETFRFFAQHDWSPTSYNYPYFTTVDPNFENANDGDLNLKYIGTPGPQKVKVDLINKTVTLGDAPDPVLYMTGAAINGWNWDAGTPVSMTYVSPGVFEATTTFHNDDPANNTFRFFAQADWGPTAYNYPYFTTVDANFENANDGDSNLRYIGTTGSHTITVNLTTKVVTLD